MLVILKSVSYEGGDFTVANKMGMPYGNYIIVLMFKRDSKWVDKGVNPDLEDALCMLAIAYDIVSDTAGDFFPIDTNTSLINIIANHFAYKCGDPDVVPLPQLGPFTLDTTSIRALIKLNNLQTVMQSK
jgi:hypothetical protein